MKVALVSTYIHPVALGLRFVSSYIKAVGHDVEILFMSSRSDSAEADFTPEVLDVFVEHCRKADLIVMTNTFFRACTLTETLRKAGVRAPILWGGTHPTVAPEESLEVADMICVGEGEEADAPAPRTPGGRPEPAGAPQPRLTGRRAFRQ